MIAVIEFQAMRLGWRTIVTVTGGHNDGLSITKWHLTRLSAERWVDRLVALSCPCQSGSTCEVEDAS